MSKVVHDVTFKIKQDDSSTWVTKNTTLAYGEPGLETDTGRMKIGDGWTPWNSLVRYYADVDEVQHIITMMLADAVVSGVEKAFEYVQNSPSASWSISLPSGFNRRPNVAIYVGGELVFADVSATTTSVNISFPSPVTGSAVLS